MPAMKEGQKAGEKTRNFIKFKRELQNSYATELFVSKPVREGLSGGGVKTLYIEPGSPWENGYNESCNGKLHNGLLNLVCCN